MAKFNISTKSFGSEVLLPQRTIRVGEKAVRTPTKAVSVKKTRDHEEVRPDARGVNELHKQVDSQSLQEERSGSSKRIRSHLREGLNKTEDGEINFVFFTHTDSSTLPVIDAAYLVELQALGDVLTVPMMQKLARSVDPDRDDPLADPAYQSYKESVARFLNQAEEREPEMPVMGMIPPLGWEYVDDLLQLYAAHDIRAYCFNFDRKKVTAARQVNMIQPLMRNIAARGIEENVLFYGINLAPGKKDAELAARPAADFASVGMGFDIIGETHVPPKLPEEVFEEIEDEDDELEFRLFDKTDYVYRDIPIDDLEEEFPEDSALDAQQVVLRTKQSPKNAKFRLQKLVNAEQMAMALQDLRDTQKLSLEDLEAKPGVTDLTSGAYQEVRAAFDEEYFQSGLSDF